MRTSAVVGKPTSDVCDGVLGHKSTAFRKEVSEATKLGTSLSAHEINKTSRLDDGEDYDKRHIVPARYCGRHWWSFQEMSLEMVEATVLNAYENGSGSGRICEVLEGIVDGAVEDSDWLPERNRIT
jgi:hypothetical protein